MFFFFKQKTAYEMRISDWSSDVCSSDLHDLGNAGALTVTAALNYNTTDIDRIAANPAVLEQGGLNLQRIGRTEIGRITKGTPKYKGKIGRASCRERVCQYV